MRSVLVVSIGILLSAEASALEKCVGADGKVGYSDHGCAAGAKRSVVAGGASLDGARLEYYDVAGPGGHPGHTDWNVSYQYRTRTERGGCGVESVTTKLDAKVRLPRWTPQTAAADLETRWNRYLSALQVHEAGHVQVARDLESNFKRAALSMSAGDCGALGTALRAQFDSLLRQAGARERDYDAQTGHGATQGAVYR